ncbi:hypothetical protein AS850_15870 [Frondihabitans sp. 762G35]|uniref:hypothetical protein n=1 Tax=Frondihabitans sp. 762G35 TaxID=1446794 RepID=UPI000D209957|nr:hypothetical protein [Frondihabitans sp. 762G35]ARC58566.1 hypothetical protein AS850_15870 [Frondihabitans sp. 762G35]
MKSSAFSRRLAVPAVLVLSVGGAAFVAAPAVAAPTTQEAPVTASPAATPTATATPSTAPAPTSAPAPTPTAAARPGATATPAARVAAPTDLALTSPTLDADGSVRVTGDRVVTLEGQAPVGSKLQVTNGNGDVIARLTTTATTFSIPLTFTTDDGYQQYLSLFGTSGAKQLTEVDFVVVFDAPTSAVPAISTPSGETYQTVPAPFSDGTPNDRVVLEGTGTPGESIFLYVESDDPFSDYSGGQWDDITVDDNGNWSGDLFVDFGTVSVTATQAKMNENYEETTVESDLSPAITFTVDRTPGAILPPVISTPNYGDLPFSADFNPGNGSYSFTTWSPASATRVSAPARTQHPLSQAAKLTAERRMQTRAQHPDTAVTPTQSAVRTLSALARVSAPRDIDFPDTLDELVEKYGIPVKGVPSATAVGKVDMTVSGTGTPGSDVVLYEEKAQPALDYLQGLYPTLFADAGQGAPLEPVGRKLLAPAAVGTGDPAATSDLPTDDGTIRVGADGTWTATLSRVPGNYLLTSFTTRNGGAATADYSVAGKVSLVHLTGTPRAVAVAPAAVTQLAFTGSNPGSAMAWALGALTAGGALLAAARRRRHRDS